MEVQLLTHHQDWLKSLLEYFHINAMSVAPSVISSFGIFFFFWGGGGFLLTLFFL